MTRLVETDVSCLGFAVGFAAGEVEPTPLLSLVDWSDLVYSCRTGRETVEGWVRK